MTLRLVVRSYQVREFQLTAINNRIEPTGSSHGSMAEATTVHGTHHDPQIFEDDVCLVTYEDPGSSSTYTHRHLVRNVVCFSCRSQKFLLPQPCVLLTQEVGFPVLEVVSPHGRVEVSTRLVAPVLWGAPLIGS